jgi:CheY-like chemotaxis protein
MSTTADHSKPASVETVLVVDGDALVRMPLARYLRDCGYRVVEAPDADAALVILRKPDIQVDVVLCDVDLPGTTNGFELAIRARSVRPGLKVVLVGTPKRAVDVAAKLCEGGPALMKPYDHTLVLQHIKRLLAARAQQQES